MKETIKKLSAVAFLALIIAVPLAQVPKAYSAELTGSEKAISFLRDVVGLDMARYNVTLKGGHIDYPYELGGLSEESLNFGLFADESQLSATFLIRNGTLSYCSMDVLKGTPLYDQPQSANVLDTAKTVLQRYQTYSGAPYLQPMREMLDAVTELKTMTATTDNITFNIKVTESVKPSTNATYLHTNFKWMDSPNGIYNTWKSMSFSIDENSFSFRDCWNLFMIGRSSLNVSREDAISMAMELAKNYTLRMYVNGSLVDVPFNITEDPIETHLTMQSREPLTLYPFWHIQLYFDKMYYTANGIEVGIWADTGEVIYCQATGIAGDFGGSSTVPSESSTSSSSTHPNASPSESSSKPSSTPPETTPTPPPPENNSAPPTATYIAAAATATTIAIAIATVALKKRHT